MASKKQTYSAREASDLIQNWLENNYSDSESDSECFSYSEEELEELNTSKELENCEVRHVNNDDVDVQQQQSTAKADNTTNYLSSTDTNVVDENDKPSSGPEPHKRMKLSTKKKTPASILPDKWDIVNDLKNDTHKHSFRFCPKETPGIQLDLNEDSSPFECFVSLFTNDVQQELIKTINLYAAEKLETFKEVEHHELVRVIAILIAMGLDKRPDIKAYWSTNDIYHTPWFSNMMPRNRFQQIYHTMLHTAGSSDTPSKEKIEPFLNKLLLKFQPIPLRDFKEKLIEDLVDLAILLTPENEKKRKVQKVDSSLERYKSKPHLVGYVNEDRNCLVCSTPVRRQRTKFICTGCSNRPHLHPKDCFGIYHTKDNIQ